MWKEEDKSTQVDHCQLDEDASAPKSSFGVQMYLCSACEQMMTSLLFPLTHVYYTA